MIYDYIEKINLRRAVLISNLFLNEKNSLEELSLTLNSSTMTIRNDLDSFLEIEQIQSVYTKNGYVYITFNEEISLAESLHIILKESLFLKYLFLDLMDVNITSILISNEEFVSVSSAAKICNKIKRFKREEKLSNDEVKRRMILVCLSRYIDIDSIIPFLNKEYLDKSKEILDKIILSTDIPKENEIQLTMTLYLFFDRAEFYPLNLPCKEIISINSLENDNKISSFLPCNDLTNEQLKVEELFVNIIYNYLYEPDTNSPLVNNHLNIQHQLEKDKSISSLRENIFSILNIEHLILRTNIFYYSIKKFITLQYLGFPLKLNFSSFYISKFKNINDYMLIINNWKEEFLVKHNLNEDISFEFFYYLRLMEEYSNIHKFIFIVSPNREHFNILYNILSTLVQTETITIDSTFYNSIDDISEEKRNNQHIIVCERSIREKTSEKIVPFSLTNIKKDLLEIYRKLYDLDT